MKEVELMTKAELKQMAFDFESARNGSGDWFTAHLFRLILKADNSNKDRLREGFPAEVDFVEAWYVKGEDWLVRVLNS